MGDHFVVLYVHEGSMRFTVTARMERARLNVVDEWADQQGYTRVELASDLDKNSAEALRDQTRAEYEERGYTYQTRS